MKSITKLIIIFITFFGCEKDLTPVENTQPEIRLTVEDVGVTEVWLKVETADGKPEDWITITRNDSTINQINHSTPDTIIYDSGLLPNHDYTYTAASTGSASERLLSEVEITTMDTTSHDFTWETLTFGDGNASVLHDVCIINENDIWAVGSISIKDSTGQYIHPPYNAIHWDGNNWQLMKIPFTGSCSIVTYPIVYSVFAFSGNDIWFARGGSLVHYDGNAYFNDCAMNTLLSGSIKKIWGATSTDIFCAGGNGAIVHYNGQTWQRIESGTSLPIQDIWGAKNEKTDDYEILCVAADQYHSIEKKIYKIENQIASPINDLGIPRSITGIWFIPNRKYYTVGSGMYSKINLDDTLLWKPLNNGLTTYYTNSIRGNHINDITVVGAFGVMLHFNGMTWKNYHYNELPIINGTYISVNFKDNIIIAVGYLNNKGIVTIGNRY
jgi:hypothetical protein